VEGKTVWRRKLPQHEVAAVISSRHTLWPQDLAAYAKHIAARSGGHKASFLPLAAN